MEPLCCRLPPNLKVYQVGQHGTLRDGAHRHERMLRDGEFDAAETSLASYMLPDPAAGLLPQSGFSTSSVQSGTDIRPRPFRYRNAGGSGRTNCRTAVVPDHAGGFGKGRSATEYGVSLKDIKWCVGSADTVEIDNNPDFDIAPILPGQKLPDMLCSGEIDALFYSRLPEVPTDRTGEFRRLFDDPKAVETDFVARNGYWPIMHLIAVKSDTMETYPTLATDLMNVFADAERIAGTFLADPNWTRLPWAKYAAEEKTAAFGKSLWTANFLQTQQT